MAELTADEIAQIRDLVQESDNVEPFTDEKFQQLYTLTTDSFFGTVAMLWGLKAGQCAKKIDAESGPTKAKWSQQYDHAVEQRGFYLDLAGGASAIGGVETFESIEMATTEDFGDDTDDIFHWPFGTFGPYS